MTPTAQMKLDQTRNWEIEVLTASKAFLMNKQNEVWPLNALGYELLDRAAGHIRQELDVLMKQERAYYSEEVA